MDGEKLSLSSAGAGIRMLLRDEFTASFAVAMPVYYSFRTEEIAKARFLFAISNVLKWCPQQSGPTCV